MKPGHFPKIFNSIFDIQLADQVNPPKNNLQARSN